MGAPQAHHQTPLHRRAPPCYRCCRHNQTRLRIQCPVCAQNTRTCLILDILGSHISLSISREDGYKYYINKKWKLRKNIPASKKAAILAVLQTRESTKAEPVVKYKGETVNPQKLRRHLKLVARSHATTKATTRMSAHESGISQYTISPLVHEM